MRCQRCEFENPAGMKFCGQCALPLTGHCPRCGFANPPGFAFCGQCATPLATAASALHPSPPSASAPSPQAYTPSHLAQKILASRSALEGERKQVTVLFADLKSSLELLADRDPEEARQLLDPVIERMMEAVHRYEGTVNQVMGDGIMALFGAPIAHEDHGVRACYAALAMQDAIRQYNAEVRRSHGIAVQMRVGLNSGEVVVRAISSDLHMDYTAVGQTTHVAARMEQLATPGSILLTVETLRLAEGFVQVTPLGPVPVKGLPEPIEVFELVGVTAVRRRLQATAARGLTPFAGRQTELDVLRQSLARAGTGHGQVVAVVGEPGVGKSRLIYECIHSHRTQAWRVLESASVSYGKATPYFPVIDLLKSYFKLEGRDDLRTIRAKVTGHLLTLDEALRDTIPAPLSLLDALPDDSPFLTLDPPQRRQRTLTALKRVLLRESQVQPLGLVFEDLHWIDAETQALLDSLLESLPTAHVLLLVNYRPEYQHGWGHKTYYTQLRLDPLPPEGADEMLHSLLGDDPGLAPLKQRLIERTEGNPFFLEECVRTLIETQMLVGERGAYHLARPIQSIQVPATVQAVLASRIDRLSPEDKRLLQTAAVIGTGVSFPLLEAIAEGPEEALRMGLAHLQAAEFLYETSLFPELEYTFKHALTHEVAYGSLLQERRRALHSRIVHALEALAGNRVDEQVERLAHHALRGEVWPQAVVYCRQAGDKAFARSANREALTYFEQALEALQHLPAERATIEHAIDVRLDLRNALLPLQDRDRGLAYLREAQGLAEALGDQRRLGQVSAYMTVYCRMIGDHEHALELAQRALAIATALGDLNHQGHAKYRLGQVYHALGLYRRAIEFFSANVEFVEGRGRYERFGGAGLPAVFGRIWLVRCLAELGEFGEGIARGEEALRIAEAANHPLSLVTACYGVGLLYLRKGDWPKAITVLERGLGLCQDSDVPGRVPEVAAALVAAYALAGRVAEALPLLQEAVARLDISAGQTEYALRCTWLSEAHLLAGRTEGAIQLAGRASELSRAHKERGHEAWARRLVGEIAMPRDPPDAEEAERHYHQALLLAAELGMRPLQAHCHLGLGTLHAKRGRREQARAELSAAIELFRAMEMTFWLMRAENTLAQTT